MESQKQIFTNEKVSAENITTSQSVPILVLQTNTNSQIIQTKTT